MSTRSLRTRLTIAVLLPLVVSLGVFMLVQYQTQQKIMLENLAMVAAQTGTTIQNSLNIAMLNHNQEELQHILDSIGKNPNLRIVYLLDPSGKVVFAPGNQGVGAQLDNRDSSCQPCHRLAPAQRPGSIVVDLPSGQRVFRTMNPIVNERQCQSCHDPAQRLNGVLLTDISLAPLEDSLRKNLLLHLVIWLAAILVSVIIVNYVINRFILHRLEAVTTAIQKLSIGQASTKLPVNQTDEIGQLSNAFNEMARQIETREAENRQLSDDLLRQNTERKELLKRLITAQEDERKRVSRDLHDELGQSLAGLALRTEATRKMIAANPEQAIQVLNQTKDLIHQTSEQMYQLILALRPSALDDLGLVAALRVYAERIFSEAGIAFKIDSTRLTSRFSPELETVLYRVFQECLNNIVRHAEAHEVSIVVSIEDQSFRGEVKDDGVGFDLDSIRSNPDEPQGLGLLGMRERVAEYHGKVEISSSVGHGTTVVVLIPLEEVPVG